MLVSAIRTRKQLLAYSVALVIVALGVPLVVLASGIGHAGGSALPFVIVFPWAYLSNWLFPTSPYPMGIVGLIQFFGYAYICVPTPKSTGFVTRFLCCIIAHAVAVALCIIGLDALGDYPK